jgi:glutathione S-transferase
MGLVYESQSSDYQMHEGIAEAVPSDHVTFHSSRLAGAELTAADLVVYPFLKSLFRAAVRPEAASHALGLLPLSRTFPAIEIWMTRIESLPGYHRTYPPGWRSSERPTQSKGGT